MRLLHPCVIAIAAGALLLLAREGRAASPTGLFDGVPEWTVQYGGFKHLDDIAVVSADTAWGVDQYQSPEGLKQTAFVRYAGGIWRVVQMVDNTMLGAVAYAAPDTALAVGLHGAIYSWNGTGWQRMYSGTDADLLNVSLLAPNDGWACGDWGTILHWDGQGWRRYPLKFELSQTGVSSCVGRPGGDAWATSLTGRILRFAGDTWQEVATPPITRPVDMAFSPGGRALVVGRGMLELADGVWRAVGDPNRSYRAVAFVGEDAYLVEDDRLVRYRAGQIEPVTLAPGPGDLTGTRFEKLIAGDGGVWALSTPGTIAWIADNVASYRWPVSPRLEAVDMVDPATGWAGGKAVLGGFVGRSPGGWATQPDPAPGSTVWDVDMVGATDGWAASFNPDVPDTMQMWRWDGRRWAPWPIDKAWHLSRLQMLAADDGWAAGGNVIGRWRGSQWDAVPGTPPGATGVLSILRGGDDPLGWFGSLGRIFKLSGTTFTEEPLPIRQSVLAIDVPVADQGWAVTSDALLGYDGTTWTPIAPPKPAESTYLDVDAVTPDNVWVLLRPPALLHWTGSDWEYHDLAPLGGNARPVRLRAVLDPARPGRTDIWLAGTPPVIARYRVLTAVSKLALPLVWQK